MPTVGQKKLGTVTLDRWELRCERCAHKWEIVGEPPGSCAACKSRYWNVKRGKLKVGRPPKSEKK